MVCLRRRLLNNREMKRNKQFSVVFVLFCVFCGLVFSHSLYAFTARVTGDRVNVRARPVRGSEIVTQLSLDEEVVVLEEGLLWTKIKAPVTSRCWIHSDYVEAGKIKGSSVNMRCGPGVAFPVLYRLNRGTQINIIEVAGDWILIEPPVEFGVWVSTKYLEYPKPEEAVEEKPMELVKTSKLAGEKQAQEEVFEEQELDIPVPLPDIPAIVSVPQEEISDIELVSYAGTLQDLGIIINRPGTYKLVSSDKWLCILRSPTLDLNPYVNRVVRIEGVKVAFASSWDIPVVEVKRLQVIK